MEGIELDISSLSVGEALYVKDIEFFQNLLFTLQAKNDIIITIIMDLIKIDNQAVMFKK